MHLPIEESKIIVSKACVNNKLHRFLDYYFCKPQDIYYE